MFVPAKCRATDDLVPVSLHNLDARLDLSFIRDWVADAYPRIDRPSTDPIVMFKLYLVMV